MAYIENDLYRLAFALKVIESYLIHKEPLIGDALYTCDVVLMSLEDGTPEGKAARDFAEKRFLRGS